MVEPQWRGTWLSLGHSDVPALFMQHDSGHFHSLFRWTAALLGMLLGVCAYRENGSCLESFLGQAKDTLSPLPYSLL